MQTDTDILTGGEKKMLDALPWAAIVLDKKGDIKETNEEWKNAVRQPYWLFPEHHDTNFFGHCAKKVEQGNDGALRLIFSIRDVLDGVRQKNELTVICDKALSKKWCKISISSLQKPRPAVMLIFTAVDKTDQVETESERERNSELMSQLFENSPLAKVMIETNGRVLKANRGFTDLFGYTKKEIIGQNVNPLIVSKKNLPEAEEINNNAFRGISHQQKTVRQNKQHEQIPVILNTVPILHEQKVIAIFGIYVDMREQIHLENKLHRTIQEKDTLLREVHHRVKNNLAIVMSLLDLQILQEENERVGKKLSEVHSRIYSIAKIHETLYQADSVVMVDFGQYLHSIRHTIPGLSEIKYNIPSDSGFEESFRLNMNQAVPLGIVIHELIRFSKKQNWYDTENIQIRMRRTGDQAEISITGLGIFFDAILKDKEYTYQYLLLKIFLEQIDATISQGKSWNEIVIRFKKNDAARGSNNALL